MLRTKTLNYYDAPNQFQQLKSAFVEATKDFEDIQNRKNITFRPEA